MHDLENQVKYTKCAMNLLVPNHFHGRRDDVPVVILPLVTRLVESCKVPKRGERFHFVGRC